MIEKVSIVMCTYNGADYLREQLDSIVHQTYPIYELIIQDDCSTDTTISILREYQKKYDYIRIFENEKQKGINDNFFSAMERATGDYIAISDQDDIWELDKIENQITTIGDKWLSCGFSRHFSDETKELYYDKRIPNLHIERLIYIGSSAPGHTILLKKELLPHIFKISIIYDHTISIVAAANDMISFVDKVLVNHREHRCSATYITPVMKRNSNHKNLKNIIQSITRTFNLYLELRGRIREQFVEIYNLLKTVQQPGTKNYALKLAEYQSKSGFIAYVKLTYYCIKARRFLFQTIEEDSILLFLRAIYFPISCSDYFRYMSKSYQKYNV